MSDCLYLYILTNSGIHPARRPAGRACPRVYCARGGWGFPDGHEAGTTLLMAEAGRKRLRILRHWPAKYAWRPDSVPSVKRMVA